MKTIRFLFLTLCLSLLVLPMIGEENLSLASNFAIDSEYNCKLGFSFSEKIWKAAFFLKRKNLLDFQNFNYLDENTNFEKPYFFDNWLLKNVYFKVAEKNFSIGFGSLSYSGMIGAFKTPHFSSINVESISNISSNQVQAYSPSFSSSAQPFSTFFQFKLYQSTLFNPKLTFIYSDLPPSRYIENNSAVPKAISFSHILLPLEKNKIKLHIGLGHGTYFQNKANETNWYISKPIREEGFYSLLGLDTAFLWKYLSLKNSLMFSQIQANDWEKANRSEILIKIPIRNFESSLYGRLFFTEPDFITAKENIEKTRFQAMLKPQFSIKKIPLPLVGRSIIEIASLCEYEIKTQSLFPLVEEEQCKIQASVSLKNLNWALLYTAKFFSPLDLFLKQVENEENQEDYIERNLCNSVLPDFFVQEKAEIKHEAVWSCYFFIDNINFFSKKIPQTTINLSTSFKHNSFPFAEEKKETTGFIEKIAVKTKDFSIEEKVLFDFKDASLEVFQTKTSINLFQYNLYFETIYKIPAQIKTWTLQFSYKTKLGKDL